MVTIPAGGKASPTVVPIPILADPPPEILISIVLVTASNKKVFPAPTKFRVLIGPLATLVPAELIPRL